MKNLKHILLASHGTDGARVAEKAAYALCGPRTVLHHLIVVPDFWKGMMGDDWLNNASTRDTYGKYIESELENEIRKHVRKIQRETARRKIRYHPEIVVGKPENCLLKYAKQGSFDLVIMGSPRPKGKPGFRSRMLSERLLKSIDIRVLIVPYPS